MLKVCRYTLPVYTKSYAIYYEQQRPATGISRSRTLQLCRSGWPWGFRAIFGQYSTLLVMCFRLGGFQSSFLLINVRYGPNTFTKVWHRTYPIYVKLHFRDRRRLASSRYRNRAKITVLLCRNGNPIWVWFYCRRESYPVQWDIVPWGVHPSSSV